MSDLLKKYEGIKIRFDEVSNLIVDPDVISDVKRYVKLNKEYKDLKKIVDVFEKYKNVVENIQSSKEILSSNEDAEFKEMAKMELEELEPQKEQLEEEIKMLLIPKDPEDSKNVIIEIRAGTGGDEASIFAGDLYRMYIKYIEKKGWKYELMTEHEGTSGGFKEISFGSFPV